MLFSDANRPLSACLFVIADGVVSYLGALATTASRALCRTMAESALVIPINSTTGSVDGSSERAAIRARQLKLRAACEEDGDFEQYKELAIGT